MSSVTNQLPVKEIKPLPIGRDVCPRLKQVIERVALLMTITSFSIGFGIALGLSNLTITLYSGGVLGGSVGLVIGVALAFFMHFPTRAIQYRLETLEQIREIIGNPRAIGAIESLHAFFQYPFSKLSHCYDHHTLHKHLATITEHIDPERLDAKRAWGAFLEHLDDTILIHPDKEIFPFKTEVERQILHGKKMEVDRVPLSSWSGRYEKDLEEIEEISRISYGKIDALSFSKIKEIVENKKPSGCILARNSDTQSVLGYCLFYRESGTVRIAQLARRPEAAALGIGLETLYEVVRANREKKLEMIVQKGHPFIRRIERFGFRQQELYPRFFGGKGGEDGVLYQMDWAEYAKLFT